MAGNTRNLSMRNALRDYINPTVASIELLIGQLRSEGNGAIQEEIHAEEDKLKGYLEEYIRLNKRNIDLDLIKEHNRIDAYINIHPSTAEYLRKYKDTLEEDQGKIQDELDLGEISRNNKYKKNF